MSNLDLSDKRIAILAPASNSNETGGAERLYKGLLSAIQEKTGYAELISFPTDESTFECIQSNYDKWGSLDLSSFDMVISTKAPTYVIKHHRHVLYLVHTIRVFYDMFDEVFPDANDIILKQREKIISLDTEAINKAKKCYAIGHEVAARLKKWNHLNAEVLHPPLGVDEFRQDKSDGYFFMPGRLHSWKRVDLAIRAVKVSKFPLKLVIAGTGEAEANLKELAADDSRIIFLGHVSDEELVEIYSKALAVIFIPLREDYGYVTLEAFKSGKPVITCTDSGEPLQFIKNGESGFISNPDPESIAGVMEQVLNDREKMIEMGQNGMKSIAHITWSNVANKLLDAGFSDSNQGLATSNENLKTRVAILDMQPIDPPVGGGRLRLLGLYHALGESIEARYIGTYDWPGEKFRHHNLSRTLEEIDVPLSDAHHVAAKQLARDAGGKTVIDLAFAKLCHLSPDYLAKAVEAVSWADVVIFSHPWVFPLMEKHLKPDQLIVYDSQNVEGFLRAQLLDKNNPTETELLREVVHAEFCVGQRAQLILACSQEDIDLFSCIYEWPVIKMKVVPNGVMASKITRPTKEEKIAAKQSVSLSPNRIATIFIGSDYHPNVEAATFIIEELSGNHPEIDFVIAGGVGVCMSGQLPKNVFITGFIDDEQRLAWLHASDIAVNPMFSGSGTNIKMFDFMAAGLPVIATHTGARGITQNTTEALLVVYREGFSNGLKALAKNNLISELGMDNRKWVERDYAWENISAGLGEMLIEYSSNKHKYHANFHRKEIEYNNKNSLRIAHISTAGHKCGIGEYTLRLVDHLPKETIVNYIITCSTSTGEPAVFVQKNDYKIIEGWYHDNQNWRDSRIHPELLNHLNDWNTDAVLIQYHDSFYDCATLKDLVESLLKAELKVAITIHKFNPSNANILSRISKLGVRFLSHSRREIEIAGKQGIALEFLPMGVEQQLTSRQQKTINERDWKAYPPIISTTGFLRSHKGVPNLINAIGILKNEFPGITLLVQCALYPATDSRDTLNACRQAIRENNLDASVHLDTEFLPIGEVCDRISKTDLAILPYIESDEGGSASATTCFTAGLPVVISRAEIFDELRDVTFTLDDTSPEAIAKTLSKIFNNPELHSQLIQKTANYSKRVSWAVVTTQLTDMFGFKNNINSKEVTVEV
jgi:glycosyltransferase involved in cell wall biosynthesis